MITIDVLKELGADVTNGVARCANNEEFYLKMVTMALGDNSFDYLKEALTNNDLDSAFERAHALKGVLGNVGLTTLFEPVAEMTEHLRGREDMDYSGYIDTIFSELEKYRSYL